MRGAINDTVGVAVANNPPGSAGDPREAEGAVGSGVGKTPGEGGW